MQLKWPNDLVHDGAKLAGLLVEGVTPPGRRLAVVVGIGVNVVSSPEGLAYPTTDLQRLAGAPIATRALFERLARRFDEALALWARGAGFAAIREAWLASAAGLGGAIRVTGARGAREGLFEGIDSQRPFAVAHGRSGRDDRIRRPDLDHSSLRADDRPPPALEMKAAQHER